MIIFLSYAILISISLGYYSAKKFWVLAISFILATSVGCALSFLLWFNSFGNSATALSLISKWVGLYSMVILPYLFFRTILKNKKDSTAIKSGLCSCFGLLYVVASIMLCTHSYVEYEYTPQGVEVVQTDEVRGDNYLVVRDGNPYSGFLEVDRAEGYLFIETENEYKGLAYTIDGKVYSTCKHAFSQFYDVITWGVEDRKSGMELPIHKEYQSQIVDAIDPHRVKYYHFRADEDEVIANHTSYRYDYGYVTLIEQREDGKYVAHYVQVGKNGLVRQIISWEQGANHCQKRSFCYFGEPETSDTATWSNSYLSQRDLVLSDFSFMDYVAPASKIDNSEFDEELRAEILTELDRFVN